MPSRLANVTPLVYCLFCGARHPAARQQPADAPAPGHAPLCPTCDSPLPPADTHTITRRPDGPAKPTERTGSPAPDHSLGRGLALDVHTRWPLQEPVAATLTRLVPDGLELTAAEAFAGDQMLKIDGRGLRGLARVTGCVPGAPGRFRTTVRWLAARVCAKA